MKGLRDEGRQQATTTLSAMSYPKGNISFKNPKRKMGALNHLKFREENILPHICSGIITCICRTQY